MPLVLACPHCRHQMTIADHLAGHAVVCPTCRASVIAPSASSDDEVAIFQSESRPRERMNRSSGVLLGVSLGVILAASGVGVWWITRESKPRPEAVQNQATRVDSRRSATPPPPPPERPKSSQEAAPPNFETATLKLKEIAATARIDGLSEFVAKEKLFSDEEKVEATRIIGQPIGKRFLLRESAILGNRMNLRKLQFARIMESMLADERAMKLAQVVWDRSPRTRSVAFLAGFLERYWIGDEGVVGDLDITAKIAFDASVDDLRDGGWKKVGEEAKGLLLGSTAACALFFEGRRGSVNAMPPEERAALIRFAGEEAILNSP